MSVYLSNKQEILFDHLKRNLFEGESDLFQRRLLIIPNRSIEFWIKLHLAEDLGIAAGIESLFIDQAIFELTGIPTPCYLELTFKIEEAIFSDPPILPLVNYISDKEKRTLPLCSHLAKLFKKYEAYQITPKEGWQKDLWQKLDHKSFISNNLNLENVHSIHLFCFNHFLTSHFDFFKALGNKVFFYELSPCQEFWSDMEGKKALNRRFKNASEETISAFEEFIEDHHPLLAEWGAVGRRVAKQIEESELRTFECYEPPTGNSALSNLQCSMLNLEKTEIVADDSIQIHLHSTHFREVEGLFDLLQHLFCEKKIEPKDVIVMAPDISPYVSSIHAIFGDKIPYAIEDLRAEEKNLPLSAFFKLIDLEKRRWGRDALLDLFQHPLILAKQNWGVEEVELIKKWTKESHVRWGYDCFHVEQILGTTFCDERGTWKGALDRLVLSLSSGAIPFADAHFLGEWCTWIHNLYRDLRPLCDGSKKEMSEWKLLILNLLEKYIGTFDEFKVISSFFDHSPNKERTFTSFESLLSEQLESQTTVYNGHHLQAIRFCSMLPMRGIPAKVVAILGLGHETFPRREKKQSLDLSRKEGAFTSAQLDRYLFLEAILSARDYLLCSYIGRSPQDGAELPPCSLISSLLNYIPSLQVIKHPDFSFPLPKITSRPKPFFSQFSPPEALETLPLGKHTILLKDLHGLFSSPLKFYLEKNQNIRLKSEKKEEECDEFVLSPLHLHQLKKEGLTSGREKMLDRFQKRIDLPLGHFQQVAYERARVELSNQEETLRDARIDTKELYSLDFTPQVKQQKEGKAPPVCFKCNSSEIEIWGMLEYLTPSGLLIFDSFDFQKVVKHLPKLLMLKSINEKAEVFFLRSGIKKTLPPLEDLTSILSYYFFALQNPSPLFPEWILPILEGDPEQLEKAYKEKSFDESRTWAFRGDFPHAEKLIEEWRWPAVKLFGGLKDAWF